MPETPFKINACENSIRFSAVIQPRSSRNEIAGVYNNSLKIRLTSPPVDGAANKTCIKFLAKWLGMSPANVRIVTGLSSKNKVIEIDGIDESVFRDKLTAKIPNLFKERQP
ncbi:MAG: DUF167 domain-containing protein [Nitrospina sp.]|jgi:uncharacterized protein|nr:DUF167 domain-containing protein [Nitrospina sp.]MBT3416394.1 DUF167 domain-containing protein [Nitrospina sp.]MBT3855824.1 DUF167 domain-containing protein [Nitrospina sp.]MBT4104172.1 DUF167 domain-containing protein [Nitrospina sp.]MBT4388160.1 DUF167 domain-containing protein [Nitrospina sp.]